MGSSTPKQPEASQPPTQQTHDSVGPPESNPRIAMCHNSYLPLGGALPGVKCLLISTYLVLTGTLGNLSHRPYSVDEESGVQSHTELGMETRFV